MESSPTDGSLGISVHLDQNPSPRKGRGMLALCFGFGCLFLVFLYIFFYFSASPTRETKNVIIEIGGGGSVQSVAKTLAEGGIIRSPAFFAVLVTVNGIETVLPSGAFQFHLPMNVFAVLAQFKARDHGIARVKITIPEGVTNKQIASILAKQLPLIIPGEFLRSAQGREGYLFPDTYFFYVNATSGPVISTLSENFSARTEALAKEMNGQRRPWEDMVIMASILEEEAATENDRAIISGILWKRINLGMRLQVDASFSYLMEKKSSEITALDLTLDSPYNTYRYAGLPPGPIGNPGLATLHAALYPQKTDYLYYLSDKNGMMHYARTFREHKLNKEKYLR